MNIDNRRDAIEDRGCRTICQIPMPG